MYLKRLEIQGFKSFADKVEFEFPSGITAIVGPNGSGKSNVVDSIRWVLGEQSIKNLRGSKMEDVIFAGSDTRRPLGMAQVALTFDNRARIFDLDYEEVTIARRLYRSGESEYLINKSASRLRDVQELLMDTGLGREGLSIISQGKVDEILSLKPEDRRGLIEEAAGIIKYKYRKREAERKLKDTEDHLLRIDDMIGELSQRVGPLEEQAEKARAYHGYKTELDQLELSVEVDGIQKNQQQADRLRDSWQKLEQQLIAVTTQLSTQQAALSQRKLEAQQQEEQFQSRQQQFYELKNQLERHQNNITTNEQLLRHTTQQRQALEQEVASQAQQAAQLQQRQDASQQQMEEARAQYETQAQQSAGWQETISQLTEQLTQLEQRQAQYQNDIFTNMRRQAENHNTVLQLEQALSGGDRSQARTRQKLEALTGQLEAQTAMYQALIEQQQTQNREQEAYQQQVKALEREIDQRKSQQFVLRQQLEATQRSWQEQSSKAKALRELEETGEGYQYGVKSVLEQKQRGSLKGIIGTVSQLLQVPQRLEKAIETTMGVSLQNIVTENDAQAQAAIGYLKERKKGRVTFLPLNTVRGQRAEEDLSQEPGVLGLAVDLIEYEEQYEHIFLHLLGKVWVIETLADAVAIGKKRGFGLRMVTLAGELVTPGGALTGGNHEKERSSLLARQRQVRELEQQIEALASQMEQDNKALDDYYAVTNQRKEALNQLKGQEAQMIRQRAQLEQQLVQANSDQRRLQGEYQLEQLNLTEQQSQLRQQQQQLEEAQAQREALQQQGDQLAALSQQEQQQMKTLQEKKEATQQQYNQLEIQLATARQRWELLQQQAQTDAQQLAAMEQSLQEKQSQLQQLQQRMAQYEQQIAAHQQLVAEETQQMTLQNQQLQQQQADRQQLQTEMMALEAQTGNTQRSQEKLTEQKYQLDAQRSRIGDYLAAGHRRLAQQFDLTLDEAVQQAIPLTQPGQTQEQIRSLKTRLQQLGEINFKAIEEFAQVQQRMTFLTTQVEDLQEARQSLHKVIAEMEKIMAQKFAETYQEVNQRFTEVFRTMFAGGQARLELSEPEDYLLTGIEIIAQPPGKKEQVLTLLSGGERAMTAIALLFALLSVKPSPFCILDEIESALDDVNIDRFARFIKDYAEKTQFIIISHRKGTMEAADVLYGVAMENKGVSKLMSVRMSDYL